MASRTSYRIVTVFVLLALLRGSGLVTAAPPETLGQTLNPLSPAAAAVCGGNLSASKDTYVNEGAPTVANGLSRQLLVGKGSRGEQRTLLTFDLARLVPAARRPRLTLPWPA